MRPRVLLVDDDVFLTGILQKRLTEAGVEVRVANNGEDGVRQATMDPPDLIVLDIVMPRKDGFQALEELHAEAKTRDIPTIMLTHMSSKEDIERCQQSGACDYLIKTQHSADEIIGRIVKRLRPGFSLVEGLVVLAVIISAGLFAFFQQQGYEARLRDAERLSSVRSAVSAFSAAAQEQLLLSGCGTQNLLAECRLCRTGACRAGEDRTADFLNPTLFAFDGKGASCAAQPGPDCRWTLEAENAEGAKVDRFRIRFYLEKSTEGLSGGKAHVIHADGRIE